MSDDIRTQFTKYNHPPETPREEMWEVIAARIRAHEPSEDATYDGVDDLEAARRRRRGWAGPRSWAAAAAVLIIGIALGRATAPGGPSAAVEQGPAETGAAVRPTAAALGFAAREHLGRSESLLTMVRADARSGRLDPSVAPWARSLLSQTRLLLDVQRGADPELDELLGELELVLIQIVGVAEAVGDEARMRTELDLTVGGMDEREVLARLRAAMPAGMGA
jgi:hypothetical protein